MPLDICQKCGGDIHQPAPQGCLCATPTLWRSRRSRRAAGEPDPNYDALALEEWDAMYGDVVVALCLSVMRIPADKLTPELWDRITELSIEGREHLAEGHEDYEDFNRTWAAILRRIKQKPQPHLAAVRGRLPQIYQQVVKQGGKAYADGHTALARHEIRGQQEDLNVDQDWNPL